eukprot:13548046-Heterocapsa_arctica.AAC.1
MNDNPLFATCYQIRRMQWWGTTKPTDAQIVPDNYMTNQRRIGSWLAARELISVADADAATVVATSSSKAP